MKKMMSLLAVVALAASTSAIAAPAFAPMGKVISSNNPYELRDSSFAGNMQYGSYMPGSVPANTQSPYGVSVPNGPMPSAPAVGDVNTVTYQATTALYGCTFQFVYQGNGKFAITALTPGCKVQNGTDLVLQ